MTLVVEKNSNNTVLVHRNHVRAKEEPLFGAPGTPLSTSTSTISSGVRSVGSIGTMPKISPLDDEANNNTADAADSDESPHSVIAERKTSQRPKGVKFQMDEAYEEADQNNERMTSKRMSETSIREEEEEENIVGKLKRNSIGIIGRQEEIKILKACLQRMVTAKRSFDKAMKFDSGFLKIPSKEIVFVTAPMAGMGATTLARKIQSYVSRSKGGLFVSTKFDRTNQVPFLEMANLFRKVCLELLVQPQSLQVVGDILHSELGDQKYMLLQWIPELKETLEEVDNPAILAHVAGTTLPLVEETKFDVEHAQQRWMYAFRVLSRALSAVVSPLVLCLDDLQWSDQPSLDLLECLISDKQNPNPFLIVGSYRHDQNNNNLDKRIQSLSDHQEKFRYNVTQVELNNHSLEDVQQMLTAMMSSDNVETVQGLAEICYQRTQGNAYFIFEWMHQLQQEGLLTFQESVWTWDEAKILQSLPKFHNVVDLLQARIQKLSLPAQTFLHCAAYLGSSFHKATVTAMWEQYYDYSHQQNNISVDELIATTLSDQKIMKESANDPNICQWAHDIVQEAAQSLLGGTNKCFRAEIGKILLHSIMNQDQLEDQLFVVVDLINQSDYDDLDNDPKTHVEFAKLNLMAAKKARDMAAFSSASKYASKGIQMMQQRGKWSTYRELTSELYTTAAMMELAMGNGTAFEEYSQIVLEHCTEREAMPLLVASIYKIGTVELQYEQAVQDSLILLKEWGTRISQRRMMKPMQALTKLCKTIAMTKRALPIAAEEWETISDPKLLHTMKLLLHLSRACLKSKQVFLNILVICKTVELTLKHGLSDAAGPAFATLGMLAIALHQDLETGSHLGHLALGMQDQMPESSRAETMYIVHAYCLPWAEKLVMEPFAKAHNSGMSVGRHDYALWALVSHYIMAPWMLGKSLVTLREYCPDVLSQAEEVCQTIQSIVVKIFWQGMVILSTDSDRDESKSTRNASLLEGEIFSASNFKGTDAVALAFVHLMQGELLLFFDVEKAADRALEDGDKFSEDVPAMFIVMMETFHRAVALYAMARKTRKRKYKKRAIELRRRIESWLDDGNPNVKHYEIFLNAEQAALDNRVDLADTRYRRAIVYAARMGHLHHTALFNERYAEFLQEIRGDQNEASNRIHEAVRFYREWGAFAKASELQTRCV